ncbi:MAG: FAD-dependent oxidoreductase [Gaiellaceae bacterium]
MTGETFDLVVLGSGAAARDTARRAADEHGARVALVESARWGGGCPNVACKPTKANLVAAELVHAVNELASRRDVPGSRRDPSQRPLLAAERILIATGSRTAVPGRPDALLLGRREA